MANYRDPFLGKTAVSGQVKTTGGLSLPKNTKKATPAPISAANWPQVVYGGMIQKKQGQPLALMQINGQDYLLKAGEKALDISVLVIHRDSVVLSWNKQKRSFKK